MIAITYENITVIEKYAYDPWGARRNPTDWRLKDTRVSFITNHGYTGHEHLDAFGIINMNGRVYDPHTAMFFSPDPFVQTPDSWLNYNRYGYCMNNPTKYTDPTGYQRMYLDMPAFEKYAAHWGEYATSGASDWSHMYRGSIHYDYNDKKYKYANGDEATEEEALKQTKPEDRKTYSGSTLGYDHLYTITIGGELRLAGSIGGEITGVKDGNFNVTNNAIAAVLATNGEVAVFGKNGGSGGSGGDIFSTAGNWTNGISVGLGAISASVGRAIGKEFAYVNTTSLIQPTQTMLKVGPANLLVSNTLSKTLTRAGFGLSLISASITIVDGYNKGWKNHHSADLVVNGALTGLSIVCPAAGLVAGGIYFVGDIASQYYYHKSLTEKLFDE